MAVLLDSGFLLASLNSSEAEHQATVTALNSIGEPIVLPVPAITEVAYLLARDIGNDAAADFISSLADTELILEAPLAEDYQGLPRFFANTLMPIWIFVDALIAATAERLNIKRLLTLDRRDFQLIRPRHCVSFELLP